jgi:hypothetical protein
VDGEAAAGDFLVGVEDLLAERGQKHGLILTVRFDCWAGAPQTD